MAKLAISLRKLRFEVDRQWPNRDRRSDGWIGDAAHAARTSDHNPDSRGIVHALDLDVDGINVNAVLREVIGDTRTSYVIHARRIWTKSSGWRAREYTGSNPHLSHIHVSIAHTTLAENDATEWFHVARTSSDILGRRELRYGLTGPDVAFVQRFIGPSRCGVADGRYGNHTVSGVQWYQGMRGLTRDGIVGRKTWGAMGVHVSF